MKTIGEYKLTDRQFYGTEKIEGNLDLYSLQSIPEGFNPTVGGYLYLPSIKSIPEGFKPTVGGNLYLPSLKTIPEGFNPTVGGDLYLPANQLKPTTYTQQGDAMLKITTKPSANSNCSVAADETTLTVSINVPSAFTTFVPEGIYDSKELPRQLKIVLPVFNKERSITNDLINDGFKVTPNGYTIDISDLLDNDVTKYLRNLMDALSAYDSLVEKTFEELKAHNSSTSIKTKKIHEFLTQYQG